MFFEFVYYGRIHTADKIAGLPILASPICNKY
nr:MAG TPA: hypothetical protein [Caudoviricetes sp.]